MIALAAFFAARALDLGFFLQQARHHPGTLTTELTAWDGGWYRLIGHQGYPAQVLTITQSGQVGRSPYAFFPAYPYLVRWLGDLTHLDYSVVAPLFSLVLGAAAAVGVGVVLRPYLGAATATTASVFWSFLPTAPLLMMAYTESLFTLEITVFFILLRRRNYLAIAPVLVAAGLTRGTLLPLAAVLLTHLIVRWHEAADLRQRLRASRGPVAMLLVSGVSTALWPGYVAWREGHWNAYLKVQDAWVDGRIAHPHWWHLVEYLGRDDNRLIGSWLVAAVAVAVIITSLLALRTRLSPELKTLALAYLLFLFATTPIWTAFFRYLLPVFTLPAVWAVAARSRWSRIAVVLVFAVLQFWWIHVFVTGFPKSYATP